jgi:hypothetical protein
MGAVLEGANRKFCVRKAQLTDISCLLSLYNLYAQNQPQLHIKIISPLLVFILVQHANIGTTYDIYGHYLKSADQEASDRLEQVYKNMKGNDVKQQQA